MKLRWQVLSVFALSVGMMTFSVGCGEKPKEDPGQPTNLGGSPSTPMGMAEGEGEEGEGETTEPETTEPETTEPGTTEPETTDPGTTEPETTEPMEEGDHEELESLMETLAKPPVALNGKIGMGLGADPVDWATLGTDVAELHRIASRLGELTPPKGEADSWAEQTAAFVAAADALKAAVDAQDAAAAGEAHGMIKASCMPCHQNHKP